MSEKWQQFLTENRVTVNREYGQDLRSAIELAEFENQEGIMLPEDYKSFCNFLGSGAFTKELGSHCNLRIRCPDIEYSNEMLASLKISLNYEVESGVISNPEEIEILLNSAFMFADNSKAHAFLWDLRTYDKSDKNHEIYLVSMRDSPLKLYSVCRDFFDFTSGFGLGIKSYSSLPKRLRPKLQQPCIFSCIPKSYSSPIK
jgi:hypothetical protein